jgi:hypothetical protein
MKRLIPNITKMQMGGEPPRKPIYVSNKNDPRLRAYQDSLNVHDKANEKIKGMRMQYGVSSDKNLSYKSSKDIEKLIKDKKLYSDIYHAKYASLTGSTTTEYDEVLKNLPIKPKGWWGNNSWKLPYYKKPVQPVVYRPKVTPTVSNKKIQMETTKVDTTPVVQPTPKTPPTPLTKKQYYEVPDANGKITLLTPEQFSRMSSGNKNDLMSKSPIMNKPKYFYEMNSSGKRQLVPESKIRGYMQTKNK